MVGAFKRLSGLRYLLKGFLGEERAAVAVFLALLMIPLTVFAFLGVDAARAYMTYARLSHAVDGAALAGARSYDQGNRDQVAEAFLKANFSEENGITLTGYQFDPLGDSASYRVSAQAEVSTVMAGLVGYDSFPLEVSATVERRLDGVELALVLDVTGAMGRGPGSKLYQMRAAALQFTALLAKDNGDFPENLFVSLVPYTATVNIGPENDDWIRPGQGNNNADFGAKEWAGCVEARSMDENGPTPLPLDLDEEPPSNPSRQFNYFLWPSTEDDMYMEDDERVPGDNDWGDRHTWSSYNLPLEHEDDATGPNLGCPQPILPLSNDRTTIDLRLNDLESLYRGGRFMSVGMAWGWRTLSPEWRSYWDVTSPGSLVPHGYDENGTLKTIILLSDGVNHWYDWSLGAPGVPLTVSPDRFDADYTAYGRLSDERLISGLNDVAKALAEDELDERMLRVCGAAIQKGIRIYGVTFGSDVTSEARQLLEACASSSDYYFHADNQEKLEQVFTVISQDLHNLRIVQ
ncbi:TadE/TadG family type IV pilus assembly protein [Fodinicurvata sediminis]|uniref:TadE/TadG family type IV pilus assembly protein n=1 Tax=Fodinicurvata sediminis TaxID=1121832 RepID=UPI0003B383F3|nr:TadE/TadG family type IV pilus assembly protein [Fodinicurvata sediminis]